MFLMSWSYFNHSYCVFSLFNLKWNNTGPHRYAFCCTYFLILYYISLHLIIIFFIHSSVWLRLTLYSLVSAKFSLSEKKLPGSDSNPRMPYSMSATKWRVFLECLSILLLHLLINLCNLEKYTGNVNEGPVRIQ